MAVFVQLNWRDLPRTTVQRETLVHTHICWQIEVCANRTYFEMSMTVVKVQANRIQ